MKCSASQSDPSRAGRNRLNTFVLYVVLLLLIPVYQSAQCVAEQPYCGVYCVFACADIEGIHVQFDQLVDKKYISSVTGSRIENLSAAVSDLGLRPAQKRGLSHLDLLISRFPVILHVRASLSDRTFDHWVVYLGTQDGKAVILDPSHGEHLVPYDELLAAWDGVGLGVARKSSDLWLWSINSWILRIALVVCVALFVYALGRILSRMCQAGRCSLAVASARSIIAFVALVFALGVCFDHFSGVGILRGGYSTRSVISLGSPPAKFDEITGAELRQLISSNERVSIVDARIPRDFLTGHIETALNLPVRTTSEYERSVIAKLEGNEPIVVYCQSRGCPYSDIVAARLKSHGLDKIVVYRDGMVGWHSAKGGAHD